MPPILLMLFTALLAQVSPEWWAPVTQLGVAGSMLIWFATRVESRMKSLETSVDRMAKAALFQILSGSNHPAVNNQAESMIKEIDRKYEDAK